MDQNAHGRRPHYNRGRRGQDRRGNERRTPPPQPPSSSQSSPSPQPSQQEAGGRDQRDHVDVEQIMREIRARIAKGSGLDISNQQIQELAARRLEAILDPRTIKPALLEQLRRGAVAADLPAAVAPASLEVKEESLSESFIRRLFKPLSATLAPILQAFKTQDTINQEAAAREAAANRRQAEWNALQFELLQRMVTETARVSVEMQSLALRIESLAGKVDFNDRRVRTMETMPPPSVSRSSGRQHEPAHGSSREAPSREAPPREAPPREASREAFREIPPREAPPREPVVYAQSPASAAAEAPAGAPSPGRPADTAPGTGHGADGPSDGTRKRRRRRRGRRSGAGQAGGAFAAVTGDQLATPGGAENAGTDDGDSDMDDSDEPGDDEPQMHVPVEAVARRELPPPPPVTASPEPAAAPSPEITPAPVPEPVSPPAPIPAPEPLQGIVWQQVTSPPDPLPAPVQPTPPRDEAAPAPEPLPRDLPDPGPPDR
jgi:hypothetical protein